MTEGGCACGAVRYRMNRRPIFVHACHCSLCQRQTGAAYAINAMVEMSALELLSGAPKPVPTPSASGKGQTVYRCPECMTAVWSCYAGAGPNIAFVRVGALDNPAAYPPDIHIYTSAKQPAVQLPDGVPAVPEYYVAKDFWPAESLARFQAARRA